MAKYQELFFEIVKIEESEEKIVEKENSKENERWFKVGWDLDEPEDKMANVYFQIREIPLIE